MNNKKFTIDKRKCIKCKKCIEVCPVASLSFSPEKNEVEFIKN
ncbi:MAG: CGLD27 family protein [Desulfobacteraceae bacterium]|nr:CGLD27 family protein [Desulfobacteraceae bacterium]